MKYDAVEVKRIHIDRFLPRGAKAVLAVCAFWRELVD
jgi:hypothetical protein